jgi:hypothetical protein
MSSLVLNDARILVAGHDFSGQSNAVALEYAAEMLDETTFGNTTRINRGGLRSVVASVAGNWDASATTSVDPASFARIGTADLPVSIVPQGATVGNLAYLMRTIAAKYETGTEVGNLLPFSLSLEGSGGQPLVRGKLLHTGSATGNVTGTAFELGDVAATEYIYGALHVFSGTGSFVVKLQSDTVATFDDEPTDRITFSTVATGTPVASEWARLAGAITHTWWRIVATNPNTRNFAVAVGIQ